MAKKKKRKKKTVISQFEVVSVEKLRPNRWNYNNLSQFGMDKLRETITTDGFVAPIIVWEPEPGTYEIIDGEHRLFAAKDSGLEKVSIVNLGSIPEERAKALTIKLNEIKGHPDTKLLADLVKEIADASHDLALTLPFPDTEIEELIKLGNESVDQVLAEAKAAGDAAFAEEDEAPPIQKNKTKDLFAILKMSQMSDDEEEELLELLRDVEDALGVEKRPYRLIIKVLRLYLRSLEEKPKKKKKKRKKAHADA